MAKQRFTWQKKAKSKLLALEPRMLFDGAAVAAAVPDPVSEPVPAPAVEPTVAPAAEAANESGTQPGINEQGVSEFENSPVSNELPSNDPLATTNELAAKTGADELGQATLEAQADPVDTLAALREAAGTPDSEIVFVDTGINQYEALATAANDKGYTVVLIDSSLDGIDQMAQYLQGRSGVEAIHILGHGGVGEQRIGTTVLNAQTLAAHETSLKQIGSALSPDGDILLYGCHVADDDGTLFVDSLALMTGADVVASDDPTGNLQSGGDWVLEYDSGVIEARSLFEGETVVGFTEVLAQPTIVSSVGSLTTPEDVTLSLAGKISVANDSAATNTMEAVITVTQGSGTLSSATGNDTVVGQSLAAQGDLAAINTFLNGLGFIPDANWSGTATIKLTVESDYTDGVNTDVSELTFSVTVAPVSDAPLGTDKTLNITEDTAVTLSVADFGFSDPNDTPADEFTSVVITALPNAGSLTLAGSGGVSAVTAGQTISVSDINANKLVYTPAANDTTTQSFKFKVVDNGAAGSNTAVADNTLSFEVTKVNDAPVTTSPAALSTDKNTTLSGIDLTQYASDPDGGSGADDAAIVEYILGSVPNAAEGQLFVQGSSVALGPNASLTPTEAANLVFVPTTNYFSPDGNNASFSFRAKDAAGLLSNESTVEIEVLGTNIAPVLTVPDAQTVAEEAALTVSGISVADADAGNGTIKLTLSAGNGNLELTDTAGVTVTGNDSGTMVVTGTVAAINTALGSNNLTYTPNDNFPNGSVAATDTITVTVNDQGNSGDPNDSGFAIGMDTKTIAVTVTPVADPPEMTGDATLPAVLEDNKTSLGQTVSSLVVPVFSDPDGDALAGIAITGNTADAQQGVWQYSADDGLTWADVGTRSQDAALLLSAAAKLRFVPADNYNGTPGALSVFVLDDSANRTFTTADAEQTLDVTAAVADNDSDVSVTGQSITTLVTPVNDPTIAEPDAITVLEDTLATGNVLNNDSDVDDELTVATFTVNGVTTNAGTTATIAGFGTLVVNANGDYTFTPDANVSGKVPTITYTLNTSTTSTLDITLTPVNDPPTLSVTGATVDIGGTLTFTDQIIVASDPDNTDAQLTFSFDSLPDRGYLTFEGKRVGPDTIVTYDKIGQLKFVDENGASDGSTSFDVTLRDGAGGLTTQTITVSIGGGVNIAPDGIGDLEADPTGGLVGEIFEDAGSYGDTIAPNPGKLISEYTNYLFQDQNQADMNAGAAGFAIVGNTANPISEGSWEYSTDDGATWKTIATDASDSQALMLSADTKVRFNPAADYSGEPGALSIRGVDNTYTGLFLGDASLNGSSFSVDVSGQLGGSNPVSNTVNTLTMTVQAVNDDPVLDTLNSPTVPDGSRTVGIGNTNLNVTDVDSPASSIRYTITDAPDIGQIRYNGFVLGVGSSFTQADIDAGRISYSAFSGDGPRNDAVTFAVTDGAANVLLDRPGGIYENGVLKPITLNISIPDDVPVPTGGGTGGTGNSVPQVSVNYPVVGDEGDPEVEGDTITITNANLRVTDGNNDPITFSITSIPDNGSLLLSGVDRPLVVGDTFTQADIDAGRLSFEHDGSENFISSIGLSFTDGPATPQNTTLAIDMTPVNDQPVLEVENAIIDEGKSFTPVISATDADGGGDKTGGFADTNTLTYTFTSPTNGELRLVNDGMTYVAADSSTYIVVPAGTVVQASELSRLRYQHDNSETSSDSFVVTVNDNSGAANATASETINITVSAVNDAPIVVKNTSTEGDIQFNTGGAEHNPKGPDYAQTSVTVDEGAVVTITNAELQAYDPDSGAEQLQYTITSVPSHGQLVLNVSGTDKVLGVGSSFTQADIDAGRVKYQHDGSESVTDTFGFTLTDAGGGLEPTGVFTIGINPVNDAPTITLPGPQTANEDQALTIRGVSIADADAGASDVSVTLSVGNGTLTLGSTTGLTFSAGDGSDDAVMTFTGSVVDINAALADLRYLGNANWSGSDTLTIAVDDKGNTGKDPGLTGTSSSEAAQATLAITVNAVNDAPVVTVPGAQTVNEDTDLTITGVSIADIDVGETAGGEVEVKLSVGEGVVTLAQTTGLSTVTGDGTATVTIKGSLSNINAAITTLTYRAAQDYFGSDKLTIVASDLGNTGLGGTKTDTKVIDITVAPVNDVPTAENLSVSATEDRTKLFTLTSADVDSGTDPVDDAQVTQYQIISLPDPDKGVLRDSTGQAIVVGQLISVAQATNMRFVPTTNANGTATFDFKAVDEAGAQSAQRTVTITIAAVNDAPVISGGGDRVDYTEGDGAGVAGTPVVLNTAGNLQVSDQELIIEGIDDFNSATLTVQRATANADDVFGFASSVTTSGANIQVSGTTVGTFAQSSGKLTVTLNGSANRSAVEFVMQAVTYSSTADDLEGEITINMQFKDGNTGAQGSGGNRASNLATFTVNVINTNDAPTLDSAMTLAAVEDTNVANAVGITISAIVGDSFSDLDASDSLGGIVITADAADRATEGFWQYSTDGSNWYDVSPNGGTALSATNALVLSASTQLRFVPVSDFNSRLNQATDHPGALSVLAIDDSNSSRVFTSGATGAFINVSAIAAIADLTSDIGWNSAAKTITAQVAQVNDAPVINNLDTVGNTFLSFTEAAGVNIAGSAVLLDTGTPATITDVDLTVRDETTFNGARLVIQNKGTIDTADLFVLQTGNGVGINGGFTLPGSGIRLFNNDSNITYGNQTVAKLTDNSSLSGQLVITFNDKADSAAVNAILTNIAYSNRNDSLSEVTDKTITVEFFDGNGTQPDNQQGTGGELSDVAEIVIRITPTNDAPLFSDDLMIQATEDLTSTSPVMPSTIADLLGGLFVDPDGVSGNSLAGVALSGFDDKGVGRWEVSFDSGSSWSALSGLQPGNSAVSDTNALLLSAFTQVRFVQDAQANTEDGDSARPSLTVFAIETDALDNNAANAPAISNFSTASTLQSIDTTADTGESRLAETASQVFVSITPVNDAPVINGLDAVSVNATDAAPYIQGGDAVVIDSDATLFDQELSAERNDWSGATLTVQRQGGASADDVFGYAGTSGSGLYFDGSAVKVNGATVGSLVNSGGVLTITFTSSAATASAVNTVLQGITYSNAVTAAGGLSYNAVTLDVTINDQNSNTTGGGTAGTTANKQDQGTGGALSATESIEINISRLPVTVDDANAVDEGLTSSDSSVISGNVLTGVGNTNGAGADSDADVGTTDRSDALVVVGAKTGSAPSYDPVSVNTTSANGTSLVGTYGSLVIGADGSYKYTLDNTKAAVQALALGESVTEAFDYRVHDGLGGYNTARLTVTVSGTNDVPIISLQNGDADTGSVTETNAVVTFSDTLTVSDIDSTDKVTATVEGVVISGGTFGGTNPLSNDDIKEMLTLTAGAIAADAVDTNNLTWTFDSGSATAFDFLAKGETLEFTYTVKVTDDSGASSGNTDTRTIVVTVTGSNDTPDIEATDVTGKVIEDVTAGSNMLQDNGSLQFTDVDLSDTSLVTASYVGVTSSAGVSVSPELSTALQTAGVFVISGDGVGTAANSGTVNWAFELDNSLTQYLAHGETVTVTYRVTVTDDSGVATEALPDEVNARTQDVTITIAGANDTPDIRVGNGDSDRLSLTENNTQIGGTGKLTVTDIDLSDKVTAEVVGVTTGGTFDGTIDTDHVMPTIEQLKAMLTVTAGAIDANEGTANNLDWTFSSGAAGVFDFLAEGESLILTYTIEVMDDSGATTGEPRTDTETVIVTITGTNNAATFGSPDSVSLTETDKQLVASGKLTVIDSDLSDDDEVSVIGVTPGAGTTFTGTNPLDDNTLKSMLTIGAGTVVGTNQKTFDWSFTSGASGDAAFDFLREGELLELVYTVEAKDGSTSDTTTVTVTITGTNDSPAITVQAGDRDRAGLTETDGVLATSGTLTVRDVDLADMVSPTVEAVTVGGTFDGTLPATDFKAMLTVAMSPNTANPVETNNLDWTFNSGAANAFDFLAKDETLQLAYTVKVTDDSGATSGEITTDVHTVLITVIGTNDTPEITTAIADFGFDEAVNASSQTLSKTGTLAFDDVDITDVIDVASEVVSEAVWSGGTLDTGLKAALEAGLSISGTDLAAPGTVNWDYTVNGVNLDFLAAGETIALTYRVTVTDSSLVNPASGGNEIDTTFQDVTITITGTNDAPEITEAIADFGFTESADASAQDLSQTGTLSFNDIDTNDVVDITSSVKTAAVWSGGTLDASLKAALEAGLSIGGTDLAAPGSVNWTYTVNDVNLDFLAAGQSITLTYTVTVTDSQGATDTDDVTITIAGANDAPVITVGAGDSAAETLTETNAGLSVSGTLSVGDLDLTDTVTATIQGLTKSGTTDGLVPSDAALEGYLTLLSAQVIDSDAVSGQIGWAFDSGSEAFDYLAVGESLVLTYKVRATDSQGVFTEQDVVITINGTNDAPEITTAIADFGFDEADDASSQTLSKSGTLAFDDVDATDLIEVASEVVSEAVWSGGTLDAGLKAALEAGLSIGGKDLAAPGTVNWNYTVSGVDLEFLAAGETIALTYRVSVTDNSNVNPASGDNEIDTTFQDVTITITGTNDAPEITNGIDDIVFTELSDAQAQTLRQSGRLEFNDVDNADVIDVSSVLLSEAVWSGGLLEAGLKQALESGLSIGGTDIAAPGSVDWSYTVSGVSLDFLAAGETIKLSYRVTVTDSQGATDTDDVTITILGTNDVPVVTNADESLFGQVVEKSTAGPGVDTATGTLTVSDDDLNDSVRWNLVGPADSKYGDLRVNPLTGVWVYQLDNTRDATVRLAQGQTAQVQYVVRATDEAGASVDQVVMITIVGRDNVLPPSLFQPIEPDSVDDEAAVVTGTVARGGVGDGRLSPIVAPELPTRLQLGPSVEFVPQPLEASRMPLRNTLVPPDVVPEFGGQVEFQLPEGTFTGGDGVIWLYATLRDGTPLPEWIQFDSATGRIVADVPPDLSEPLEIRVQARDAHGETAETVFKILPRGDGLGFQGKPSLTAQFQQMMDLHN